MAAFTHEGYALLSGFLIGRSRWTATLQEVSIRFQGYPGRRAGHTSVSFGAAEEDALGVAAEDVWEPAFPERVLEMKGPKAMATVSADAVQIGLGQHRHGALQTGCRNARRTIQRRVSVWMVEVGLVVGVCENSF